MHILNEKQLVENIDRIAHYDFLNNKVFGSAYFVYQAGNLAIERCYGTISLESDAPVTNTTLFRLASMTKPVTAVAALILVDRGLLSLDDRVDTYLPQFRDIHILDSLLNDLGEPNRMPTIRDILCHCSGLGSDEIKLQRRLDSDNESIDNTIIFLTKVGLDYEPGTKQAYSGFAAFDVLTKVIELISGMDYLKFLEKEICRPCDMMDTTFVPNMAQRKRLADIHMCIDSENKVFKMQDDCVFEGFPCTHYLGGAGLVSTLHDYCNFAKMLLHKGKFENYRILREETFNQLCTPQVSANIMPGSERWGLGVRVIAEETYPYLPTSAFGWSGAYGSHFWVDPINNIFAVFMKNSKVDGGAGNESARKFEEAVYTS